MGLFSKKPTTAQKKEIEASLSRLGTVAKRLESVDSIDKYITEWDKYLSEYNVLSTYERQGIKFSLPLKKFHTQICAEIPRIEKDVLNRSFDRMQRDAIKLTTDKGKKKKAESFFQEIQFYYPRLQPSTVELVEKLKGNCVFLVNSSQSMAVTAKSGQTKVNCCKVCGAILDEGALFCGKCGSKQ